MIVIGNPHIICTNKYWRILWEYCREHGGCIPFKQCPLKPDHIKNLLSNDKVYSGDQKASNAKKLSVTVELGKMKNKDIMTTRTLDNVLVRTMKDLTLTTE